MKHEIITAAIDGFEAQKKRIDAQIADLRQALTGNGAHGVAAPEAMRRRRKMSANARKRIADAQRKRWAAMRERSGPTAVEAARPKRRISAAGRKAIIEATRKRWAAYHAQKTSAKKASANR
jgi:hypothetical protein